MAVRDSSIESLSNFLGSYIHPFFLAYLLRTSINSAVSIYSPTTLNQYSDGEQGVPHVSHGRIALGTWPGSTKSGQG